MELLLVGFGSLCLAGFAGAILLSQNPDFRWPWQKRPSWISGIIPEPTYCTMVDPVVRTRGVHHGVALASRASPGKSFGENRGIADSPVAASESVRQALPAGQVASRLSGQSLNWRIGAPTDSHLALSPEPGFHHPLESLGRELTFHSPNRGLSFPDGTGYGLTGDIEGGFPRQGGFNSAALDSGASGFPRSDGNGEGSGWPDSLRMHARSGYPGGRERALQERVLSRGNAHSPTPGSLRTSEPIVTEPFPSGLHEIEDIPGRVIRPSSSPGPGAGPASTSPPSSFQSSTGNSSPSSASTRTFRPIAPPAISTIAVGGAVAGAAAGGGSSSGGTPMMTGSAAPQTSGSPSGPRGPIAPLPPTSIPEASVGGGAGGGLPASGGASGFPVPAESSMGYAPPPGGSAAPGAELPSGGVPTVVTPIPAVIPPQGAGGVAGLPVGVGVPAGGIGSGAGGGGIPSGGGDASPSFDAVLSPGRSENPGGGSSQANPPAGSSAYFPPSSSSPGSPGTRYAPASDSAGSSPGSSSPNGNAVSPAPSLVPIVPAAGMGAAGAGAAAGGVTAGGPAPVPSLPPGEEEFEEPADENSLPKQCIPWVVQEGQSLQSLAQSIGTTPGVILEINKTGSIVPGQVIRLPAPVMVPCCE